MFVIIDVRPGVQGLPTTAYEAVEEVEAEGKEIRHVFKHIQSSIEAEEAEEVRNLYDCNRFIIKVLEVSTMHEDFLCNTPLVAFCTLLT